MSRIDPYETRAEDYDRWFVRHRYVYDAELKAVRELVPETGRGIEVGVGTGRFAQPLGIAIGIDPSPAMMKFSAERGINLIAGRAETLPLRAGICDFVMMITILHLLDDVRSAVKECRRILIPGGKIIIAYIERDSPMGREYFRPHQDEPDGYFHEAHFYSTDEISDILQGSGFQKPEFVQTIFRAVDAIVDPEPVEPGYGRGSFVVVRAVKAV